VQALELQGLFAHSLAQFPALLGGFALRTKLCFRSGGHSLGGY
jgi:hypothetical protein